MKDLRNETPEQKRMGLRFTLPVLAAVLPFSASSAADVDTSLPGGETIFSGRAVAELNAAWREIAGLRAEFPLEAKRSILEALRSAPVVAGFLYRDNDGNGAHTPGEETSVTLLGAPRLDGLEKQAGLNWNCYWFSDLKAGGEYKLVYDVDGTEPFEAVVTLSAGLNIVHIPVKPTKPWVYVTTHSHFDPEWMKSYEAYLADEFPNIRDRLEVLREDPAHGFALDEECVVRPLVERHPEVVDELRARILEGTVETKGIVAAGDLTMPYGESLIRQITVGEKVLEDAIGVRVSTDVFWNMDNYGVCFQLPQILAKAGRKYFLLGEYWEFPGIREDRQKRDSFLKFALDKANPHYKEYIPFSDPRIWDHTEFFMQALDGSKILVHRSWYHSYFTEQIFTREDLDVSYMSRFNFHGKDMSGPNRKLTEEIAEFNRDTDKSHKAVLTTSSQFFRAVEVAPDLPTFTTESWLGRWTGSYESRVKARQYSRRLECELLSLETLFCMANVAGLKTPDRELMEAWYLTLINHHHDPQMTPMGPDLIDEVIGRYEEIEKSLYKLYPRGLVDRIGYDRKKYSGTPFAVFNPLPWPLSRVVSGHGGTKVADHEGNAVPAQAAGMDDALRERALFVARDLPPMGWRTYFLSEGESASNAGAKVDGNVMENQHLRVRFIDGLIMEVTIKATGEKVAGGINELVVWEDEGCICRIMPVAFPEEAKLVGRSSETERRFRFVESGPARVVAETTFSLDRNTFTQRVILDSDAVTLKFETDVNWAPPETGGRRIRVAFPFAAKNAKVLRDVPFAVVDGEQNHVIRPVNSWMGLAKADDSLGAALIHQGTCSIQAEEDTMWMTLFRSVRVTDQCTGGWDVPGDHSLERGPNSFTYWFYPFSGSWSDAGVARVALEVNMPIRPFWLRHPQGKLPLEKSLVSLEPVGLVLSAFKPADDGNACILRVFNPGPEEIAGTLSASEDFVDAMETDFLEQKTGDLALKDGTIALSFSPYEVKTVRLQYRDGE